MNPEEEKLLHECEVQSFKASGKGGQHVQKTESAVRLIHIPTGIVVTSQQERSQYLNKKICLEKLQKKLAERLKKRKKRIPTKKPKAAKEKVLKEKKLLSFKKKRGRIKDLPMDSLSFKMIANQDDNCNQNRKTQKREDSCGEKRKSIEPAIDEKGI